MIESDATKLIRILWQQQELIEFLLENRVSLEDTSNEIDFTKIVNELEIRLLKSALEKTNNNYLQSAKILKLKKSTFAAKLIRFNLHRAKNETTNTKSN